MCGTQTELVRYFPRAPEMALAWIRWDYGLAKKPAVLKMAKLLKLDRWAVAGRLMEVWEWADGVTVDGYIGNADVTFVDELIDTVGFGKAMIAVGWLEQYDDRDGIAFPRWNVHNSQSAKRRGLTAHRVATHRNRQALQERYKSVTGALQERYKSVTREEKRREEKKQQHAAASSAPLLEGQATLIAAGIDESQAATLAGDPAISADLIAATVDWAKEKPGLRKPAAFIVRMLRDPPAELLERVKANEQRAEAKDQQKADAARLAVEREIVRAIPKAEWAAVVEVACNTIRRRHPPSKPEREYKQFGQNVELLQPAWIEAAAAAWRERQAKDES